jgi:hypothetical protein
MKDRVRKEGGGRGREGREEGGERGTYGSVEKVRMTSNFSKLQFTIPHKLQNQPNPTPHIKPTTNSPA